LAGANFPWGYIYPTVCGRIPCQRSFFPPPASLLLYLYNHLTCVFFWSADFFLSARKSLRCFLQPILLQGVLKSLGSHPLVVLNRVILQCSPMVFSRQFSSVPIFLCTVCHALTYRSQLLLPISQTLLSPLSIHPVFFSYTYTVIILLHFRPLHLYLLRRQTSIRCSFLAYTREHMFVSPPLSPSELRNFFYAYDLECGSNRVFLCPTGSWFFFFARQNSFFLRLIQPSPSNAGPESNPSLPIPLSTITQ